MTIKVIPHKEYLKKIQEEDSILVCLKGSCKIFHDNIEGTCADCGCKIHYRHYNDKATIKLCLDCASKRMEAKK